MPGFMPTAEDDERPMVVPEAIHDRKQSVVGHQVYSEEGVSCPHCGRFQLFHLVTEPARTTCEVCGEPYYWCRQVSIHYRSSTIPFERIPE